MLLLPSPIATTQEPGHTFPFHDREWMVKIESVREVTYRVTISQSPVKALEDEDANSLASSISRTTVVKSVAFSVFVQERSVKIPD